MSRTFKDSPHRKADRGRSGRRGRQRHISVRSIRRDPPDLHKLSRAVIALAMAQADAEAQAAAERNAEPAAVEQDHEEPADGR